MMSGGIKSHKDLVVWQESMTLAKMIYEITAKFPDEERYGLVSQLRRAAISIPSNIAEGSARNSAKEYAHYLSIARGSLAEVETQIELARMLGFDVNVDSDFEDKLDHVGRMLTKLIKGIR